MPKWFNRGSLCYWAEGESKKEENVTTHCVKKGVWISWFLGGKALVPYLSQQLGQL